MKKHQKWRTGSKDPHRNRNTDLRASNNPICLDVTHISTKQILMGRSCKISLIWPRFSFPSPALKMSSNHEDVEKVFIFFWGTRGQLVPPEASWDRCCLLKLQHAADALPTYSSWSLYIVVGKMLGPTGVFFPRLLGGWCLCHPEIAVWDLLHMLWTFCACERAWPRFLFIFFFYG